MTARRINGKWYADFRFTDPRRPGQRERVRKKSPVNTKRGAEEFERKLRQQMLEGAPEEVPLFEVFADHWLDVYTRKANNRASTRESKESAIRLYLKPAFAGLKLDEITTEKIDELAASMSEDGLSGKTIHNTLVIVALMLKTAHRWGKLNAVPHIEKPKLAKNPEFDWLRRGESKAVLGAARDEEDRVTLLFALDTGARAGEQKALEWGDLDFRNGKVIIRRSHVRGNIEPPKSGRIRSVPMTERLKRTLKAHRHLKGDLVFCRKEGARLTTDDLHTVLWRSLRRAGLRRVRWHDLRHTWASQLASAGVPLLQIMEWGGWTSLAMVQRYAHLAPGANMSMIGVLERPGGPYLGNETGRSRKYLEALGVLVTSTVFKTDGAG